MIRSKRDYLDYLEADRAALGITRRKPRWFGDDVWKFQRLLRRVEHQLNCGGNGPLARVRRFWLLQRLRRASIRLGMLIPPNVFGPGLAIQHYGSITVHPQVRVGRNCRINICVNIGTNKSGGAVPRLGDDVYIGPGAKIFGDIQIADGVTIGANAVVNRSVLEPNIKVGGIPARKLPPRNADLDAAASR